MAARISSERTLDIDDLIIKNWNQKISNGDTVYILGDVGKEGKSEMNEYLCRCLSVLKGRKILITGNQDKVQDLRIKQQFTEIYPYKEIYDVVDKKSNKIVLCHFQFCSGMDNMKEAFIFMAIYMTQKKRKSFRNSSEM